MLDGLDRVEWARLTHGHGPATDVPAALRALALGGASQAARALATLDDTLCHQGRCYGGTVAAIPFLAELALRPGPRTPGLLHLLRAIAAPSCARMLAQGQSTRAFYADVTGSATDRDNTGAASGTSRHVDAECHSAVARALPQLLPLLDSDAPAQVAAMLMLLAEFPAAGTDTAPRIFAAIKRSGTPTVRRAGLATLGQLSRSVEVDPADPHLRRWLDPAQPLPIRVEAALSMTVKEAARRDVLLEGLRHSDALYQSDTADRALFPRPGWTADRVATCLARWRGDDAHRVETAKAIITALPRARAAGTATTGQVRALLAVLADGAPIEGLFRGRRRSRLSELDRQALQAIAAQGDWITGDTRNAAFADMMHRCGLPDTARDLARFAIRPGVLARLLRR
ncbi:hypothetical protein [Antarctobacter heliothermus]|uniref:HEAT repeat-containing protein n=1 Tax=Antarctobacter heliothermus TaxID=74033 RepID=A0A239DNM2_9RHOB|nr:hypothetical protein [Antarctobacter heliothermus]SNS33779.1 hypothetical protein SAMN04488078_101168 [Antarctobacter heliothermus]